MPKANRKKPQTIDFNEYLALLMKLKGDDLKQWNRESTRRSNLLQREFFEASTANIDKYLSTPGADQSLIEQKKHAGKITLNWEIDMEPGECRLRVSAGRHGADLGLVAGHPVLDRITVKRFTSLINEHLVAAALSLYEASAIYSSEQVQKSRPRYSRDRFINEQTKRLEALTAKPTELGRPKNTRKDCLRKEDEANELKANVILAVQNLYQGKSDGTYHCQHKQGPCSGHDVEDIDISLAANYLNKSGGTLRNQLSRHKLRFPEEGVCIR
jgi:hypothetical protein